MHKEEFNFFSVIKPRRMGLGHVARMVDIKNSQRTSQKTWREEITWEMYA